MERPARPELCIIAAFEEHSRVMGREGTLIWKLPSDMRRFVALTKNQTVVMGRKTWLSMGGRALDDRNNIVVSRELGPQQAAAVCCKFETALRLAKRTGAERICFIGGEKIFEEALKVADTLYLTLVSDPKVKGDVYFPSYNGFGTITEQSPNYEENGVSFRFLTLKRKTAVVA